MAKIWVSYTYRRRGGEQQFMDDVLDLPFNDICTVEQIAEVRATIIRVCLSAPKTLLSVSILNWKALLF